MAIKKMRKKMPAVKIVKRKAKKRDKGEFLEPEDIELSPEEIKKEKAKRLADRAYHDLKAQRFESAYKLYMTAAGTIPKDCKEILSYLWYAGIARSKLAVAGVERWISVMTHFKKLSERASSMNDSKLSNSAFYQASLALIYSKLNDAEMLAKEKQFVKAIKACEEIQNLQGDLSGVEKGFKEEKKMLEILIWQKEISYKIKQFRKIEILAKKIGIKDSDRAQKFKEVRDNIWYEFSNTCSEDMQKIKKLTKTVEVFETKRDIIVNTAESLQGLYLAIPDPDTEFLKVVLTLYETAALMSSELYDSTKNFRYRGEQMIYAAKHKNLKSDIAKFGGLPEKVFESDLEEFEKGLNLQKQIDGLEQEFEENLAQVEGRLPLFKDVKVNKEFWENAEDEAKNLEKKLEAEKKATREIETDRHDEIIKTLDKERAAESES